MTRLASISSVAVLLLSILPVRSAPAQTSRAPRQIDVTASDFAFLPLPAQISAGLTMFSFANRGKVQHELSLARLRSGATMDDFVKARDDLPRRRQLIDRSVGILIAGPGNRPDGRILVDLIKGATYVVFCNLRDTPDAPAHLMFGMYTSFTPK